MHTHTTWRLIIKLLVPCKCLYISSSLYSPVYYLIDNPLSSPSLSLFTTSALDSPRAPRIRCSRDALDVLTKTSNTSMITMALPIMLQWIEAAFDGESTNFRNGNADFGKYGFVGRQQVIQKGSSYMNIFMYVIREFEDALDDCQNGIISDNYNSVHVWDEGVCFYTGSLEVCLLTVAVSSWKLLIILITFSLYY